VDRAWILFFRIFLVQTVSRITNWHDANMPMIRCWLDTTNQSKHVTPVTHHLGHQRSVPTASAPTRSVALDTGRAATSTFAQLSSIIQCYCFVNPWTDDYFLGSRVGPWPTRTIWSVSTLAGGKEGTGHNRVTASFKIEKSPVLLPARVPAPLHSPEKIVAGSNKHLRWRPSFLSSRILF
jgi:hypothetical protein